MALFIGMLGVVLFTTTNEPFLKYFLGLGSIAEAVVFVVLLKVMTVEQRESFLKGFRGNRVVRLFVEAIVFGLLALVFGGQLIADVIESNSYKARGLTLFVLMFAAYKLGQLVGPRGLLGTGASDDRSNASS